MPSAARPWWVGRISHRRLETLPGSAAGVALVAEHHGGPLLGGHGAGAGVGEEIDAAVLGVEQEDVVVGRGKRLLALGVGRDLEGFRHLDAEGLDDRAHVFLRGWCGRDPLVRVTRTGRSERSKTQPAASAFDLSSINLATC